MEEPADIFGSDEDCRSCESGWTMYLASQSHDHNYHCYDHDDDDDNEEEDSDGGESMESDASSGPMEAATSSLKVPHDEIDEKSSTKKKKKKTNEDMVIVENTTRIHDDDDDDGGDNHDYDDGNDRYSVVNSYVGLVREEGSV